MLPVPECCTRISSCGIFSVTTSRSKLRGAELLLLKGCSRSIVKGVKSTGCQDVFYFFFDGA